MRRKCADDARSMAAMSGRSYAGMGRLSSLICRYMRPGAFDAEHLGRRVRAALLRAQRPPRQQERGIPLYSRWPSLNPRRARPPATIRAIQLTDFGTDQSAMMTVHSSKIRTKWSNATRAKISPATKENVF